MDAIQGLSTGNHSSYVYTNTRQSDLTVKAVSRERVDPFYNIHNALSIISGFVAVLLPLQKKNTTSPITAGISRDLSRASPFPILHIVIDRERIVAMYRLFTATTSPPPHLHISIYPYIRLDLDVVKSRCLHFRVENCRSYLPRALLVATAPRMCSFNSMIEISSAAGGQSVEAMVGVATVR